MTKGKFANIPIDILRTVSVIADCRSIPHAGARLGLSQPGISAQMKKLQALVGGPVFKRDENGLQLTDLGRRLMPHCAAILGLNDQIANLGGVATSRADYIRVGVQDALVRSFLTALPISLRGSVQIVCNTPEAIEKGVLDGYFDVGCYFGEESCGAGFVRKWTEELAWAAGRTFQAHSGYPLPLVSRSTFIFDQIALNILRASSISYQVVFDCIDFRARVMAVEAGLGLMAIPRAVLNAQFDLRDAKDLYLPQLPRVTAYIRCREGFEVPSLLAEVLHGLTL